MTVEDSGEKGSRRGAASGWTARQWLRVGVSAALTVLLVLGVLGAWTLNRTSSLMGDVVDVRTPALISSVRLEAALLNQETGVRGYGLSGRQDFLTPYTEGLADEKVALTRLRPLIKGDGQARTDLNAVLAAASAWQERIARPIAAAPPGTVVALAAERTAEGKGTFDRLRQALVSQQDHLQAERVASGAELDRALTMRNWLFSAIAVLIVLMAGLVFEGLRRGITDPLGRLARDVRHVTAGRFDHMITASGPADLRELAGDVERMRQRLADELARAEEARGLLDEQAADLRRSNAELEQFAYVASHDLQEPLRKVSSFTQLLQRRYAGQMDERADQYIGFAVDGANRMQRLINDLLDFSRVGRMHNQQSMVDLDTSLGDSLDALSVVIEESGARITRDPLPTVVGDSTQMNMLWQNLISNALKFRSPDRAPDIRIAVREQGDIWEFSVTDNGIGISPDFADKVFVIFQRLHTKDAYPGNGIGLAMCKKIVEFHGGVIGLDDSHGPGARITFTLPVHSPADGDTTDETP
ncbi:ATP-binding protein [Streptomyces sp. NPDC020965]|uniref:sensor histidine kinase n=1 Tax=Streptomyces sp. NPDC020965 TaxID=3365105 RepID=UPI0037B7F6A1